MINSPPASFGTVAIVGVGLIGGSLAAALKTAGVRKVLGVGRNPTRLRGALDLGLIDSFTDSLAEGARADLIVFCTPVNRIVSGIREIAPHCSPGTLVTDAGSVKANICRALTKGLPSGVNFIGSHPIAGSEKQGYEAARSDLFHGKTCVVTPTEQSIPTALERTKLFWESVGCRVVELSPERHDEILARTSHLPHLLASALAAALPSEERQFTGSGFRDTTRIAAGDAELWQAILSENAPALLSAARDFEEIWKQLLQTLETGNHRRLGELLKLGQTNREGLN